MQLVIGAHFHGFTCGLCSTDPSVATVRLNQILPQMPSDMVTFPTPTNEGARNLDRFYHLFTDRSIIPLLCLFLVLVASLI